MPFDVFEQEVLTVRCVCVCVSPLLFPHFARIVSGRREKAADILSSIAMAGMSRATLIAH